ncbi:TonB-dependent receptor, partial [Lysobacter sp. 2RAB21]
IYVDSSPIEHLRGDGHNYFRSRNVAWTRSASAFGEGYWRISETLKLSAGLRYTHDVKVSTPTPSQLLLAPLLQAGGNVQQGYPEKPEVRQRWGELTGRLVFDWKPDIAFTDSTLAYASVTRGYKAGGTNPAGPDFNPAFLQLPERATEYKPEYIVSFEIGTKNTLLDGALQL